MQHFKNRSAAGKILASALNAYQNSTNTLVLALPRGGVPVAYEISLSLHLPLDVFLVRKLGMPKHEEYAIGAIAEEDICFIDEMLIKRFGISDAQIKSIVDKEKHELHRRLEQYRQGKKLIEIEGKTIILVDDGIATGATTKAAIAALNTLKPKSIVLAVPVASKESVQELRPLVTEFICPLIPKELYGVGQWYEHFDQTSDEEVIRLLTDIKNRMKHS